MKFSFSQVVSKVKAKAMPAMVGLTTTAALAVPCFASGGGDSVSIPTVAITPEMMAPLGEGVVANIAVILPYGLGLFAIMLGIRVIPGLISRFVHM